MSGHELSRRAVLKGGGAALAGLSVLRVAGPALASDGDGEVVPWLDQPAPNPVPDVVGHPLVWEELDTFITPNEKFFTVKHYAEPHLDADAWRLSIGGLVERPMVLSLADLKAHSRRAVTFTLECSGNTGLPFFIGGVGNARWAGAALAPVLRKAGPLDRGVDVVFWGADSGDVVVRGGWADNPGSEMTITETFARSMSVEEALDPDNLLCYEMNNVALPSEHGAPVRLIAPGWYGVANVKWLTRIEVIDHRYAGRFMARDYVTIREEDRDGVPTWTFATVRKDRLKSVPARVTRRGDDYTISGVAYGAAIDQVHVSIDSGPWVPARLSGPGGDGVTWRFWHQAWSAPGPGEHTIASRAIDRHGNVQPIPDDPFLAAKRTYWESNGQITRRILVA